jgi:hypothetical protein
VDATRHVLEDDGEYARMARPVHPYGDGRAAERIVSALTSTMKRASAAVLTTLALVVGAATLVACGSASTKAASAPQTKPADAPELKIDSQLRVEINRVQNKPAPPGGTGVRIDAEKRALVDIRAAVTPELIATVGASGIVVSASTRDQSTIVWMPLLKLNEVATWPTVHAIVPAAEAIMQSNPASGQEFTLHVGGAVTVTDARITVSVENVKDSRCPVNLRCFVQGDAVLRLQLVGGNGARETVELHTWDRMGLREAVFQGHRVRLARLLPNPPDANVPQDRYLATFVVTAR